MNERDARRLVASKAAAAVRALDPIKLSRDVRTARDILRIRAAREKLAQELDARADPQPRPKSQSRPIDPDQLALDLTQE